LMRCASCTSMSRSHRSLAAVSCSRPLRTASLF
jgi:hypothetical protein